MSFGVGVVIGRWDGLQSVPSYHVSKGVDNRREGVINKWSSCNFHPNPRLTLLDCNLDISSILWEDFRSNPCPHMCSRGVRKLGWYHMRIRIHLRPRFCFVLLFGHSRKQGCIVGIPIPPYGLGFYLNISSIATTALNGWRAPAAIVSASFPIWDHHLFWSFSAGQYPLYDSREGDRGSGPFD